MIRGIKKRILFPVVMLSLTAMISCEQSPEPAELVKYMTVQTEYATDVINSDVNIFNSYTTFAIRVDTMGFVSTIDPDTILLDSDVPDFVNPVTRSVRDKFLAAGFTKVEDNPDFAVNIVVLEDFSFYQSVNYGGYYPGYGYYGYYSYYYPVVNTYSSNFITMVIQVVDNKNYVPNGNKYKVIWTSFIGDLGTTQNLRGNTLEAVGQAFIQSPYISID